MKDQVRDSVKTFVIKRYTTFKNITDVALRNYNQTMLLKNLREDFGRDYSVAYLQLLTSEDIKGVMEVIRNIKSKGLDEVKRRMIFKLNEES